MIIFLLTLINYSISQVDSTSYDNGIEAITEQAVKAQLDFLASDWTEGRETGKRGAYIASDYIASMFNVLLCSMPQSVLNKACLVWFIASLQPLNYLLQLNTLKTMPTARGLGLNNKHLKF